MLTFVDIENGILSSNRMRGLGMIAVVGFWCYLVLPGGLLGSRANKGGRAGTHV